MLKNSAKPKKQIYKNYSQEDFDVWKILFEKQIQYLQNKVATEFIDSLKKMKFNSNKIPNFNKINKILKSSTGWKIKTVPNIAEAKEFFSCLSKKQFTTTCWLRSMAEIDYLEEPDMFHDVFAHIPLLINKNYSNFFHELGKIGASVIGDKEKLKKLQRLYWFTIEFGLMRSKNAFKIYGAGIISSKEESENAMAKSSTKKEYNVKQIMNHSFRTDVIQDTYYVINSFEELKNSIDEIRCELYDS
ncbi:MAG: phenylalanine 4-monooxygenase [Flavobacteriaceae bacterium]|nr:phenylalanine 4-monooxygenase [Flavobacteriaceae bacterium]|tara:strand:+ start:91 stop:825 length:735 start_codon:yes stop_codon:yes gene_type:complete